MRFARYGHLRMGPQNQGRERILRVHHIEEGKARIRPRRRQDLKERRMLRIVGITIARNPSCIRRESQGFSAGRIFGW